MKKFFLVKDDFINTRLDKWFIKNVCDVPHSLIEKNIRKGNIKINNKKEKSSYKLKKNDEITINNINFTPDLSSNKKKSLPYKPSKTELSQSTNMFVENNENFVVINKPTGISVQSGTKSKKNIVDILRKTEEFSGMSPYPVHRIDKETTGILIVAKNRMYAQLFTSLFRIRKIHKTYLGVVFGELHEKKGTFNDFLFSYEGNKKIKEKAITHYSVIDSNNYYSLLKLNPETGRKHQLRRQLLLHGYPIIGDSKYRILDKRKISKNSFMLHSYKINFSINAVKYSFYADPPLKFMKFLKEKYLKIS